MTAAHSEKKLFSVTLDELLSSDEVLKIAEENGKREKKRKIYKSNGKNYFTFLPLFIIQLGIKTVSPIPPKHIII